MKNLRILRIPLMAMIALATAALFLTLASHSDSQYVSAGHSISERVIGIPFEKALVDYCEALSRIDGVTGVSYRDYDVMEKTAVVTVHYDPQRTTDQQIRTYLGHTRSIWEDPLQA